MIPEWMEGNFFIGWLSGVLSFAFILAVTGFYSDVTKPWLEKRRVRKAKLASPSSPRPAALPPPPPPRERYSGQRPAPFVGSVHPGNNGVQWVPAAPVTTEMTAAKPAPPGAIKAVPDPGPPAGVERRRHRDPKNQRRRRRDEPGQ